MVPPYPCPSITRTETHSQPWINRLAFEGKHRECALVYPVERLSLHKRCRPSRPSANSRRASDLFVERLLFRRRSRFSDRVYSGP